MIVGDRKVLIKRSYWARKGNYDKCDALKEETTKCRMDLSDIMTIYFLLTMYDVNVS